MWFLVSVEYRRLGDSGLYVSAIAYGNWLTHGNGADDRTALACVARALDAGITTFDTADVYAGGRAEELLGAALAGARRDSIVICSKVGLPAGHGPNDRGLSRNHIIASCHAALRRLGTDRIDLYQAHRFDDNTPLEETFGAFADLLRKGSILYVGVSEWTPAQLREGQRIAEHAGIKIVSNQPQYSMLWRVPESELVPACADLGISQIAYSPLAQGVLAGKYPPDQAVPVGSRAWRRSSESSSINRYMSDELRRRVERLRPIAGSLNLSLAQLGLAWVLHNKQFAAVITGASQPGQIDENARAVEARLDSDVMRSIDLALGDLVERDPQKAGRP